MTAAAFPVKTSDSYGFAAQLGLQYNLDQIAAGDKLWLQATYEKGAIGYIEGGNLSLVPGAPSGDRTPVNNNNYPVGFFPTGHFDCVYAVFGGGCERQQGFAVLASMKHYWIPTLSSSVFGSYMQEYYSSNAQYGVGGGTGAVNFENVRLGTNLVWTPVRGFDIGGEFMFIRDINSGPAVSGNQFTKGLTGLPAGVVGQPFKRPRTSTKVAFACSARSDRLHDKTVSAHDRGCRLDRRIDRGGTERQAASGTFHEAHPAV